MRFHEFKESRTDEIAPAAMAALRTAGSVAGKAVGAAAKAGVKAGAAAGRVGAKMGAKAGDMAKTAIQKKAEVLKVNAGNMAADKLLKKGLKVPIGNQEVQIDKVVGQEVTLADPKNKMGPKTVLNKKSPEIQNLVKTLAGE